MLCAVKAALLSIGKRHFGSEHKAFIFCRLLKLVFISRLTNVGSTEVEQAHKKEQKRSSSFGASKHKLKNVVGEAANVDVSTTNLFEIFHSYVSGTNSTH